MAPNTLQGHTTGNAGGAVNSRLTWPLLRLSPNQTHKALLLVTCPVCKQQAGLGLGSKPHVLVVVDEVISIPGRNRCPGRGCGQGPEHTGICRAQRTWGSLTCFVGSAHFPDVLVAAGGEDLNEAGFIGASPLQRTQQTTGLLQPPHWHQEREQVPCHCPSPQSTNPSNRCHEESLGCCCCLTAGSQAVLHSPRKAPANDTTW